jgi:chromosome segregation ATPase
LNSDIDVFESDVEDLWNAIGNIDDKLDEFEEDITVIIEWKNGLNIPLDSTEDINSINARIDLCEEDITEINSSLLTHEEDINDINEWREGLIIPNYEEDIAEINSRLDS